MNPRGCRAERREKRKRRKKEERQSAQKARFVGTWRETLKQKRLQTSTNSRLEEPQTLFSLTATQEGLLISLENADRTLKFIKWPSNLKFLSEKENVAEETFRYIFRGVFIVSSNKQKRFVTNTVVKWRKS